MTEPFLTTVVGSMPKPAWLMEQVPLSLAGREGETEDHGRRGAAGPETVEIGRAERPLIAAPVDGGAIIWLKLPEEADARVLHRRVEAHQRHKLWMALNSEGSGPCA